MNRVKPENHRPRIVGAAAALVFGLAVLGGCSDGEKQSQGSASDILKAAEQWRNEHERGCPTVMVLKSSGTLDKEAPADDTWGEHFRVSCGSSAITVRSNGQDGKPNTEDDVLVSSAGR